VTNSSLGSAQSGRFSTQCTPTGEAGMVESVHADPNTGNYDVVIEGGRVIDPESGLDDLRNIGIVGGEIRAITTSGLLGRKKIDARGLIIVPGLIDMHSHALDLAGQRLQAMDGVTTALELECGAPDVGSAYAEAAQDGRLINYGYSASWAGVRMHVMAGEDRAATSGHVLATLGSHRWKRDARLGEHVKMRDLLENQLRDGALGIGILLGYSPYADPYEMIDVARLAQEHGLPTFTHARPLVEQDSSVPVDGAREIAEIAASTGAHMHYCHINSTSNQHIDRACIVLDAATAEGARITAESYPYGAGMTVVGAESLRPETLSAYELEVTDIIYSKTGRALTSLEELAELRRVDPGGLVFERYFDEQASPNRLARMLAPDDWAVVSDAMPLVWNGPRNETQWPLPAHATTHPRSAGTFGRTLKLALTGAIGLTLGQAVSKCTLQPASILEAASPAMRRKGRLQVGCDADITILDPEAVTDRATYINTTLPSQGFRHVLVGGVSVVQDGELQMDVRPGRPVRNSS